MPLGWKTKNRGKLSYAGSSVRVNTVRPQEAMSPSYVPNRKLLAEKIPSAEADWDSIQRFALTFDGYKHWGGAEKCGEIANARRHNTMTELRTCLFYEQRRWHHFGEVPDEDAMRYIREVLEQICVRTKLANDLLS